MIEKQLEFVFNHFLHNTNFVSYKELASGHINDTYLIISSEKPYFVLQRINRGVFKDIPGLIENKVAISNHISQKLEQCYEKTQERTVLAFITTINGDSYYKDDKGDFWNLMFFINNSVTHDVVESEEIAYEGGRIFGEFLALTEDFNVNDLTEVIPMFHDMSYRYQQFEDALVIASQKRLSLTKAEVKLVRDLSVEMHILQNLKDSGAIKTRVTHNDTKISNVLFSKNNKALCVIDTDTVMAGIVHYDFGDAIRTICNTAAEDETDLDLVEFNVDYYHAFTKGFLESIRSTISPMEKEHLPLAAQTMIFIMGLRFLTDYLNGDIYYKTKYRNHNLDRAKNQFKLLDSLSKQLSKL